MNSHDGSIDASRQAVVDAYRLLIATTLQGLGTEVHDDGDRDQHDADQAGETSQDAVAPSERPDA